MFGKSFKLFKLFGFTVRIDLSWLIILVLVVWSLAAGVFPAEVKGLSWEAYLAMGLIAAVGLFGSVILHELCHSLVARLYGMEMKGITLFLFGGVAEMADEPPSARAEFFMAGAGPAFSVVFGGIFLGLSFLARAASLPASVVDVIGWIGLINLALAAFNLIPGFPLDGGRVLRSILWYFKGDLRWSTQVASRVGAGFGIVLIGLGILSLLLGNPIGGLWWILIGWFVRSAARQGYQQVLIRQALSGETVRKFMTDKPVTVDPEASVEELVENYVYRHHHKLYPVATDGHLTGCVTLRQIKTVPRDSWRTVHVRDIVSDCSENNTIAPDMDAMEALSRMNSRQTGRMMVVEDGKLVGIVTLRDLMKFLSAKLELESAETPMSKGP